MADDQYIGYLKYSGSAVEEGYLDAKKAAKALIGFDEALRNFVESELPELRGKSFEIPVRIQVGSWEALIPVTIAQWITAGIGSAATAYLIKAASTLAQNDFKDKHLVDVFRDALKMLQWIIRLGIHLKGLSIKEIKGIKWESDNNIALIPNGEGKIIEVPRKVLEKYDAIPPKFLSKMAQLIQAERDMKIGVIKDGNREEVNITYSEKYYFTDEEGDLTESILPELIHGKMAELEGEITRGNEKTNSIGFEYKGHVLNCIPEKGSIVTYKQTLFRKCKISGVISRMSESGLPNAKKPKIIFSQIVPIEPEDKNLKLFE